MLKDNKDVAQTVDTGMRHTDGLTAQESADAKDLSGAGRAINSLALSVQTALSLIDDLSVILGPVLIEATESSELVGEAEGAAPFTQLSRLIREQVVRLNTANSKLAELMSRIDL